MATAERVSTAPAIRPLRLELVDLQLARVAGVTVVIADDDFPEVVMFEGDPFVRDPRIGPTSYRQVRAFHAIGG